MKYLAHITGIVQPGEKRGQLIGFPTININIQNSSTQTPAPGVYISRSQIHGIWYASMTNIGGSKTFATENVHSTETHILNFDQDIYGQEVNIEILEKIRDVQKFSGIKALQKQLEQDKITTEKFFQ